MVEVASSASDRKRKGEIKKNKIIGHRDTKVDDDSFTHSDI